MSFSLWYNACKHYPLYIWIEHMVLEAIVWVSSLVLNAPWIALNVAESPTWTAMEPWNYPQHHHDITTKIPWFFLFGTLWPNFQTFKKLFKQLKNLFVVSQPSRMLKNHLGTISKIEYGVSSTKCPQRGKLSNWRIRGHSEMVALASLYRLCGFLQQHES